MMTSLQELPEGLSWDTKFPDYPILQISNKNCTASIALHGAHLTHWQPSGEKHPVLYTSPTALYKNGTAIRGGIPLCWPWFNAHPTAPETHPSHGVARNRFWTLEKVKQSSLETELTFILPSTSEIATHVPFPYTVKAHFHLGKECSLNLTTTNNGKENILVGGALHTYLAISQLADISIIGLQNTPYLDTSTQPNSSKLQEDAELLIKGEQDRIYYGSKNTVELHDPIWQRRIQVHKEGSLTTVVWNPAKEKAAALKDLPDDGYENFVCIEACNAREDARILTPGESHCLATSLRVS